METQDRREFVRSLALGASAAVVIAPGASRADDPKPKDKEPEKKTEPKPEEAARTEVDARMELILARFGKQLDADARKAVRSEIEGHVRRAEALRKIKLDNGDEPFPVFIPFRGSED